MKYEYCRCLLTYITTIILYGWDNVNWFLFDILVPHTNFNKSQTTSQGVPGNTWLTHFRKNNGRNQRKYMILHMTSIRSIFTPLRPRDDALLVKMYSMQIFRYLGLVVKVLFKVRKSVLSNQVRYLFSTSIRRCLAPQGICKKISALQYIPIYAQIRKCSSPVAGSVYSGTTGCHNGKVRCRQ